MSIQSHMKIVTANDCCVYWSNPQLQTDGSYSFDIPVEINCLWLDEEDLYDHAQAKETVSNAKVYVDEDIDENAMLFHGKLTDAEVVANLNNPHGIRKAYQIRKFRKIPSRSRPGEYLRFVVL